MPTDRDNMEHARANAKGWLAAIKEMLENLNEAASDNEREEAEQAIHESVLSVLVRDGWREPGKPSAGADEYEILLTTGGPGLRIWGKLSEDGEPHTAELQMQDWGTPWTCYAIAHTKAGGNDLLLAFARQFYFGE